MRYSWCVVASLSVCLVTKADVVLTVENPGVQQSQVSGVLTETFNSLSAGSYTNLISSVGTFTAPTPGFAIVNADQYGGADGSGLYFAIGAQSGQTQADLALDLGTPQSYVGLWLSALDPQNHIEIYSGGTLMASYDPNALLAAIGSNPAYYGNPNPPLGRNTREAYAYLNFIGTNGTTFDRIRFSNRSTSSGLELDNISIRSAPLTEIPGTVVPGGVQQAVPLPSVATAGLALVGALGLRRGRRSPTDE